MSTKEAREALDSLDRMAQTYDFDGPEHERARNILTAALDELDTLTPCDGCRVTHNPGECP